MKFARLDDSAATVLESKKKMIPIALADEGLLVMICEIRSGQGLRKRLADRGFLIGESIKIIKNSHFGGPMVLEVKGTRFVIGCGEAQRILVVTA